MSVLVDWGVRPDWSRDGRKLLFMERGLGDAYSVDAKTRELKPLTAHFYNPGFDRVLALANGDYLLTGPREVDPKDPWSGRHARFEMFVLDRSLTKPPVPLGAFLDEGPAVSRTRMHVAWTLPGQREMREADIVYENGVPKLANERLVLSYADRPQSERLETQDFGPPDEQELLFSCYSGTEEEPFLFSDVCGSTSRAAASRATRGRPSSTTSPSRSSRTARTRWSRATATVSTGGGRSTSTGSRSTARTRPSA